MMVLVTCLDNLFQRMILIQYVAHKYEPGASCIIYNFYGHVYTDY